MACGSCGGKAKKSRNVKNSGGKKKKR